MAGSLNTISCAEPQGPVHEAYYRNLKNRKQETTHA